MSITLIFFLINVVVSDYNFNLKKKKFNAAITDCGINLKNNFNVVTNECSITDVYANMAQTH